MGDGKRFIANIFRAGWANKWKRRSDYPYNPTRHYVFPLTRPAQIETMNSILKLFLGTLILPTSLGTSAFYLPYTTKQGFYIFVQLEHMHKNMGQVIDVSINSLSFKIQPSIATWIDCVNTWIEAWDWVAGSSWLLASCQFASLRKPAETDLL